MLDIQAVDTGRRAYRGGAGHAVKRADAGVRAALQQVLEQGQSVGVAVVRHAGRPVERRPTPPRILLVDLHLPLLHKEPGGLQLRGRQKVVDFVRELCQTRNHKFAVRFEVCHATCQTVSEACPRTVICLVHLQVLYLTVVGGKVEGCACAAVERGEPPVARLRLDFLKPRHIAEAQRINVLYGRMLTSNPT